MVRSGRDQLRARDGQQGGDGDRAGRGAAVRPGFSGGLLERAGTAPTRSVRGVGGNLVDPGDLDGPRHGAIRNLDGDLAPAGRDAVPWVVSADAGGGDPALP